MAKQSNDLNGRGKAMRRRAVARNRDEEPWPRKAVNCGGKARKGDATTKFCGDMQWICNDVSRYVEQWHSTEELGLARE